MTRLSVLRKDGGYDRWVRRTDGPLLVLALVFLVVFLVPLYAPGLPAGWRALLVVVGNAVV